MVKRKPFFFAVGFIPIGNLGQVDHDPTGEVYLSQNRNHIAFNFDIKDDKEETHLVKVFDNNLNLVFENEFKNQNLLTCCLSQLQLSMDMSMFRLQVWGPGGSFESGPEDMRIFM